MMNRAVKLAKDKEDEELFRLGAVIVDRSKRIIASSTNKMTKTHPIQKQWSKKVSNGKQIYLHAEIAALVKCRKQPYAIYVARVLKDNTEALARPCPVCMAALKEAGVKKIFYTIGKNEIGVIRI